MKWFSPIVAGLMLAMSHSAFAGGEAERTIRGAMDDSVRLCRDQAMQTDCKRLSGSELDALAGIPVLEAARGRFRISYGGAEYWVKRTEVRLGRSKRTRHDAAGKAPAAGRGMNE